MAMGTKGKLQSTSFLDTVHDRSSCAICQCILKGRNGDLQSVTCWNNSSDEIRKSQCKVYSTSYDRFGRGKVFQGKEQEAGSTSNGLKEKERQVLRPGTLHKDFFIASSSYYGGPGGLVQGSNDEKIEIKVAVKELEKTKDPFDVHCTPGGSWWEGSLYY